MTVKKSLYLLPALLLSTAGCDPGGGSLLGSEDGSLPGGGGEDEEEIDPADRDDDEDGFTPNDGDCDDSDADTNPDGDEGDLADGVDQDCNGTADDQTVGECDGHVQDYETIQEGIDNAPNRFVLLVCPGTYTENLTASSNIVTVRSIEGASQTTIDGAGARALVVGSSAGDFALEGFTVVNGVAEDGGAVSCNRGDITLIGNIFDGNQAVGDGTEFTGDGGAVYANECDVELADNTFTNNSAGHSGGGAYFVNSGGTIGTSLYDSNTAVEGGGLSVNSGGADVIGNTVTNNEATNVDEDTYGTGSGGGGVWIAGNPRIVDNVIANNSSTYNGGGIWIMNGTGDFTGNTVEANYSSEDGGGFYSRQSRNYISGNTFVGNTAADDAGGLRIYVGRHTIDDNQFIGNTAGDDGGGLKMSHSSNPVSNSYFEGNSAGDAGGGLELDNETAPVTGCTFINNSANRGGGLHTWRNEGTISIHDNYFEGNSADCGGGIAFDNDRYLVTVSEAWFEGNNANDGGAFCLDKQPQKGPDDEIGTEDDFFHESNVLVRNSFFVDNDATDDGGAVYVKFGEATFDFVTIHRSDAPNGGAIFAKPEAVVHVSNSILDDNDGDTAFTTEEDGTITFEYNNLIGNDGGFGGNATDPVGTAGNISVPSGFTDAAAGDYTLAAGSQCIDAANPALSDVNGTAADMGGFGGPGGA